MDNCSEHCINTENTIVNMETGKTLTTDANVIASSTQRDDAVNDNDNEDGTSTDQGNASDTNGDNNNTERYGFNTSSYCFLFFFQLSYFLLCIK